MLPKLMLQYHVLDMIVLGILAMGSLVQKDQLVLRGVLTGRDFLSSMGPA